jgi:hypothetical protein
LCSCCFPLRVFRGCWLDLAPRSSSTPVATWIWHEKFTEVSEWSWVHRPNSWVEFSSAPIHSPSLVCHSGPSSGFSASYRSLLSLTSLRSKDGIPRKGIRSSALRWDELPERASRPLSGFWWIEWQDD